YVAVAWRLPDGSRLEPIPANNLIPFDALATAPTTTTPSTTTPSTVTGTKARITVTFASAPATATARIAPALYNKTRVLQFEEDDSPVSLYTDIYPVLKGGVASNGVRYPGLRFTDGCGHSRTYTAAAALNGHNPYNNAIWMDPGAQHDATKLLWTQAQELLNNGWDMENHSDLHTATNPAQQMAGLDALITSRLNGYKPSVMVVPTNYAGYCTAAFGAGYIAASSSSQNDNLPVFNPYTDRRVALSTLPAPTIPFVFQRYNADQVYGEYEQGQISRLNAISTDLMAAGTAGEVYSQRVFAHSMDVGVFASWMNYTQSIAQDQLWVTSLREFAEYRRMSTQVVKSETLSGNTFTVDLDYAGISANTRFQNLTLLVNSPGTITNITVTGADSSSLNLATKMVNIFRHEAATTTTAPPTSGSGTGCSGTGSLTREQWSNLGGTGLAAT
ncbi:hypothetical protein, partial [Hymenobacter negativus]